MPGQNDICDDMPPRIFDLLEYNANHYGHKDCLFASKEGGSWKKLNVGEVHRMVDALSLSLIQMDVHKGDCVAIMSDSNPLWNIIDFAILQIGAIVVPIHLNIGRSDLRHIISHCQPKAIFVRDSEMQEWLTSVCGDVATAVVAVNSQAGSTSFDGMPQVVADDVALLHRLVEARAAVQPDDTASIIYTSGTSGIPKGAMLSHRNIMSNIANYANYVPRIERAVSHLPLSHIFERSVQYTRIYCGISIYYAESQATIMRDVIEVKANSFSTVPRVIERMYNWITNSGTELEPGRVRNMLGGELVFISSGGSSLSPLLVEFCTRMGFPVVEGYGLTETSPMISINRLTHGMLKAGSVGLPCPNLDVRIDEDSGEILVKGSSVMKGYYKDTALTHKAFDSDGFFHTGDKGMIDDEGFLFVRGRIDDIFKTSMGKLVVPSVVEAKLCESPYIDKAVVVGEGERFVAALIIPDYSSLKSWCLENSIAVNDCEELADDRRVKKLMENEVATCNSMLGNAQRVRRFKILKGDWTVAGGELTPSMKIRRNVVIEKNRETITDLFRQ